MADEMDLRTDAMMCVSLAWMMMGAMIGPIISEASDSPSDHKECWSQDRDRGAHEVFLWKDGGVVSYSVGIRIGRGACHIIDHDLVLKFDQIFHP